MLLRVAVFEIHPVLLSTEQADLGRGWGKAVGWIGERHCYCL